MYKITIKTVLLAAGLTVCGMTTADGRGSNGVTPSPAIMKVVINERERALIITGRNFGLMLPTVLLADQTLGVRRFSDNEVVAGLPQGLMAATYAVAVITSHRRRASSNLFSVVLPGGVGGK